MEANLAGVTVISRVGVTVIPTMAIVVRLVGVTATSQVGATVTPTIIITVRKANVMIKDTVRIKKLTSLVWVMVIKNTTTTVRPVRHAGPRYSLYSTVGNPFRLVRG